MKVYLLPLDATQSFFYCDETDPEDDRDHVEDQPRPGLWSWLERRWRSFQYELHHAEGGLALRARRVWDWLHTLTRPDETMLARLRSVKHVDLYYPSSNDVEAVRSVWMNYLTSRKRSHLVCLSYNALLAIPAVAILWALPGPNVIGFWFAYRSLHHWRIVRGVQAVREGSIATLYHAESTLDLPVERDSDGKLRHAALPGQGARLDHHLKRLMPGRYRGMVIHWARLAVPNALSILRIVLAVAFPWVQTSWRGGVVIAAGLSDLFDGQLSRALGGTSTLGQILDPVADKLFVGIVLLTFMAEGRITPAELVLVGFRDIAVLGGSLWSVIRYGWGSVRHMPPSWLGKLATTGQIVLLLLLTQSSEQATLLIRPIEVVAVTMSVLAGLDYLRRNIST